MEGAKAKIYEPWGGGMVLWERRAREQRKWPRYGLILRHITQKNEQHLLRRNNRQIGILPRKLVFS